MRDSGAPAVYVHIVEIKIQSAQMTATFGLVGKATSDRSRAISGTFLWTQNILRYVEVLLIILHRSVAG